MNIQNVLVVDPIKGEYFGNVEVNGKKISTVEKLSTTEDYDYILLPGFVDLHTHAHMKIDTMFANQEDIKKWATLNFKQGVTTFYPTTVSTSIENIVSILERLNDLPLSAKAIHLEGPFVNPEKKGAQNADFIFPSKGKDLEKILKPPVKIMTAAPEVEGFDNLYEQCSKKGIEISLGHTAADFKTMEKAFKSGLKKITHFPNALTQLHHREIGGTGAGLFYNFMLEMIVDGIHSSPDFVKMIFKIKGANSIILITDSMAAAGMPDGQYELGGLDVFVKSNKAVLENGALAGSTLLFNDAVKNFSQYTNCTYQELVRVSSFNALKTMGLTADYGLIETDYLANFVILDKDLNVLETYFEGEKVFSL